MYVLTPVRSLCMSQTRSSMLRARQGPPTPTAIHSHSYVYDAAGIGQQLIKHDTSIATLLPDLSVRVGPCCD